MNTDVFELLEKKIEILLEKYQSLQRENLSLHDERIRLLSEREGFKTRIDAILLKLEGM